MKEKTPTADTVFPLKNFDGSASKNHVFLNNIISNPNIIVGDYTFYHDFENPYNFEKYNAAYFPKESSVKLIIGKYCSLAHGVLFLSSLTNHHMDGFSTYPFPAFWGKDVGYDYYFPEKGDTKIGNNVWIGCEATIMPGVSIGDGAIIGTRSVVTKDVAPYSIFAGNPAKEIRLRFDQKIIDKLQKIQWWKWPHEVVLKNAPIIVGNNIEKLEECNLSLND